MGAAERAALLQILIHGALSRADLAGRLGLSRGRLTRITRDLIEKKLLAEGATEARSAMGRPSELLVLQPASHHFLGVKLTGDVLYAVVTDLGAKIVASTEVTLSSRSVTDVVGEIAGVARRFMEEMPTLTAVGVSLAGHIRHERDGEVVDDSAYLGWDGVPLATLVAAATGLPTTIENDVQALTASEHWFGAGAGLDSMALVTIGVGLGIGLVINGQLVEGAHGRPGMLSHMIIDPAGPVCGSHRGCVSSFLPNDSIVAALEVPGLTYSGALALARAGDPAAVAVFERAANALGVLIAVIANLTDPRKVVLTGDGLGLYDVASEAVHSAVAASTDPDAAPIDLDVQPFDFSEWARAAAVCAIRGMLR